MRGAAFLVIFATVVCTSAADTRRTGKREEVIAVVTALADKYGCEHEKANLVDTLASISTANTKRQNETRVKCAEDRAKAGQELAAAELAAEEHYKSEVAKFAQRRDHKIQSAKNESAAVRAKHEKAHADAQTAEAKAKRRQAEEHANFVEAGKAWVDVQKQIAENVTASLRLKDSTIQNARDTKADQYATADEALAGEHLMAETVFNSTMDSCQAAYDQASAVHAKDEEAIREVERLTDTLGLCSKNANTTAESTEGQQAVPVAPAAFVETSSRALRGSFVGLDDQVLLEVDASARCRVARARLELLRRADSTDTSGFGTNVQTMKEDLRLARAKAADTKEKCDLAARNVLKASKSAAETASIDEKSRAHSTAERAIQAAINAQESTKKQLDERLAQEKATHGAAKKAYDDVVLLHTEAIATTQEKEAEIVSADGPVITAEGVAANQTNAANQHYAEKVAAEAGAKSTTILAARGVHEERLSTINAGCEASTNELTLEMQTISDIGNSLGALQLVAKEDNVCKDAVCPTDICPDGKGRRLIEGNCCACPAAAVTPAPATPAARMPSPRPY